MLWNHKVQQEVQSGNWGGAAESNILSAHWPITNSFLPQFPVKGNHGGYNDLLQLQNLGNPFNLIKIIQMVKYFIPKC